MKNVRLNPLSVLMGLGMVLMGISVGSVSTSWAMGASPSQKEESRLDPDHYQEGKARGWKSGYSLAENIAAKILGTQGCSGIWKVESALVRVMREVKVPSQESPETQFGRGFLSGYLDGLKASEYRSRELCGQSVHLSGSFAGQLYGSYACVALEWDSNGFLMSVLEPLFSGWAGERKENEWECRAAASEILETCTSTEVAAEAALVLRSACEVRL